MLRRLPRRLKKPVPFVVEVLPNFKRRKIKKVLDLGCGAGRHCVLTGKNRFDVVGVDISPSALRMAIEWVQKERLANVAFVRATMTNLPFKKRHFHAVIGASVVHHALKKDILKTVSEVHRILTRNGIFSANLVSVKDPRYGKGLKVENNTFSVPEAFEEKRFEELHHYFTKREVFKLLANFTEAKIEILKDKPHYWKITAIK